MSVTALVRGVSFNAAGNATGLILAMVGSVLVARVLGPAEQGELSYAHWLVGSVGGLAAGGLASAASRYVAQARGASPEAVPALARGLLRLGALASAVGLLAAAGWAALVLEPPSTGYGLVAASMVLPLGISRIGSGALAGAGRFGLAAALAAAGAAVQLALVAAALAVAPGVPSVLAAQLATSVSSAAASAIAVRRALGSPAGSARALPPGQRTEILHYGLSVTAMLAIDAVVWQRSEIFFLERLAPVEEVGYYALSHTWGALLAQLFAAFSGAFLPLVAQAHGAGGDRPVGPLYQAATRWLALVAAPAALIPAALAASLATFVYGEAYRPMAAALRIVLVGALPGLVAAAGSSVLYATGRTGFMLRWGVVAAALDVLLAFLLVPRHGAAGAAAAGAIAQAFAVGVSARYLVRSLGVAFPAAAVLRCLAAAALGAIVAEVAASSVAPAAPLARLLAGGAAGGMTYLAGLTVMRPLPPGEAARVLAALRGAAARRSRLPGTALGVPAEERA